MNYTSGHVALLGSFLCACSSPSRVPPPDRQDAQAHEAPRAPDAAATPAAEPSEDATTGPTTALDTFDDEPAGGTPRGMSFGRTGAGRTGRWTVQAVEDAPSPPNVLAQIDPDPTDSRFPVATADQPILRDLRLSVRCKPVSGRVDQACGLVFRFRDQDNYYLTRANALENNVRLYVVQDGRRRQLASWSGAVRAGHWHEYAVSVRGDHIQVFWEGAKVLEESDSTFPDAGRAGIWTKADSVTYFDDLSVSALDPGGSR